jgi:hypothetical protein
MDLKPDGLCVYMKQLNKTAYNFSVSLILIPFFIILNFLNKKRKQSYLQARIWNHFIANSKFIDKAIYDLIKE